MARMKKFPDAPPQALWPLVFDFADFLGDGVAISAVTEVAISATRGVDAAPASRLYNAPVIDGQRAVQWLRHPVLGETYKLRAVIAAGDGREWSVTGTVTIAEV